MSDPSTTFGPERNAGDADEGSVILIELGVLSNLEAAIKR